MLKTVFFGTPQIAVPFLELLAKETNVSLVVTQADKPSGRGLVLKHSAVKQFALDNNLPVISPQTLKEAVPQIANLKAEIGICVAYGRFFKKPALESFKRGIINVHFSLLPKYRGASPVQSALFNGETETGVTLFYIQEGMDDGPIISQTKVAVTKQDEANTLFTKLTQVGLTLLKDFLTRAKKGYFASTPQKGTPTFAPLIAKDRAMLNFSQQTADEINNTVRALGAGAPSYAKAQTIDGQIVQIIKTSIKDCPQAKNLPVGAVVSIERNRGFFVQCKSGIIFIETTRPAGKGLMSAFAYINGKKYRQEEALFR